MPVTRRYLCDDCGHEFTKFHMNREEPVPECERCAAATKNIPGMFAITGIKSKAIDYTHAMMEQDYGMTNMRDNAKEGEAYALPPAPVQTAEREQLTRAIMETVQGEASPEVRADLAENVNEFWKTGKTPQHPIEQAKIQEATTVGVQAQRSDGADPIGLLHEGQKKAGGGMKLDVVSRSKMN